MFVSEATGSNCIELSTQAERRSISEPNVQIEHPVGVGEKSHDVSLDRNAVPVDLVVEGLTEHDAHLSKKWKRAQSRRSVPSS
jgi:hypothetical protein